MAWHRLGIAGLTLGLMASALAQDFSALEGPYRALALGTEGRVFIGGERELIEVDPETQQIVKRWPRRVEELSASADGSVWGLGEGKLFRVDPARREIEPVAARPPRWKGAVTSLASQSLEEVVVASEFGGIARIEISGARWHAEILRAEGHRSAPIGDVVVDRNGQPWWLGNCAPSRRARGGRGEGSCTLFRGVPGGGAAPVQSGVSGLALGPEALPSVVLEDGTVVFPAAHQLRQEAPLAAASTRYFLAHDCAGAVWISGQGDRAVWESFQDSWIRRVSAPAEIGSLVALASRCPGDEVYLLGTAGLARWSQDGPSQIVYLASLEQRVSRSLLVGVAVGLVLIAILIAMAAFVYRKYRRGPPRRWSITDGLVGVTTFVIIQGGSQLVLLAVWGVSVEDPLGLLISFLAGALTACGWLALRMRQSGLEAKDIGLHLRGDLFRELGWGVLAVLPAWLLVAGTVFVAEWIGLPSFLYTQEAAAAFMTQHEWPALLAVTFIGVVLAPLVEEILFRGFLLTAIRRRWGSVPAVLVTAALFGAIHIEGMLTVGALGFAFAVLTLWRRSLVPSIVAHAMINGASLLILFLA